MQCFRCQASLPAEAPACPDCGFSLAEMDRKFGVVPRHSQEVSDGAGLFSGRARARIVRQLHLLRGRFPEVQLSIFSCSVLNRPAREYGYWVFNRCRFQQVGLRFGRCRSLLLLFNRADASVSLTCGYGLENVLAEEEIARILEAGVADWKKSEYEKGTLCVLEALTEALRRAVREAAAEDRESPAASTGRAA